MVNLIYWIAAREAPKVGQHLASFIAELVDKFDRVSLDDFHLIGHSLGAHVAGFAGQHLNGKLARITGLDPAKPLFSTSNTTKRLDESDAKFVDVIHTAGGLVSLENDVTHLQLEKTC